MDTPRGWGSRPVQTSEEEGSGDREVSCPGLPMQRWTSLDAREVPLYALCANGDKGANAPTFRGAILTVRSYGITPLRRRGKDMPGSIGPPQGRCASLISSKVDSLKRREYIHSRLS